MTDYELSARAAGTVNKLANHWKCTESEAIEECIDRIILLKLYAKNPNPPKPGDVWLLAVMEYQYAPPQTEEEKEASAQRYLGERNAERSKEIRRQEAREASAHALSPSLIRTGVDEVGLVLTSLEYSKRNIRDGGAPYNIKQQSLRDIDRVASKLRTRKTRTFGTR